MIQAIEKLKTSRKPVRVGPQDHGRRMSLDDFDEAIGQEGYLYELGKGAVEVSNVPPPPHARQVQECRNQLTVYQLANPDSIYLLGGGGETKLLIGPSQSERHPDLSVYLSPPPEVKDVWSMWVPSLVIEVVSENSAKRDYEDKAPEYLEFGVDEYWIIDPIRKQMTAMQRWRGQWKSKTIRTSQKYATPLLPGFALNLKRVLTAK